MGRKGSRRTRNKRSRVRKYRGGGMPTMVPGAVNANPMLSPSSASLAQGAEYDKIHMGQHGGAYTPMSGAPLGDTGVLDSSLRGLARIGPIDASFTAIQGMSDQSGGRRRSRRSKRSKRSKGSKKSKMSRRRMRGGFVNVRPGNASAPGTLLPPSMESRAVGGMNPEWKLAADPNSFAPKV